MKKKILVIGSLNMDFLIETAKIPEPGETVLGRSVSHIPGGKGANQAYAAGRLDGDVAMIGAVGDDAYGKMLTGSLRSAGVDISGIETCSGMSTGQAYISLEASGENCIIVIPGANLLVTPELIERHMDLVDACDYILTQFEIPLDTVRFIQKLARRKNKRLIVDPAPAVPDLEPGFWEGISIIKPNETELALLTGLKMNSREEYIAGARALIEKGVETVVLTLGKTGCIAVSGQEARFFPAHVVKTVDTTAAGDSFTAALAIALSEGNDIKDAVAFAQNVCAVVVTRKGAQSSIPGRNELHGGDALSK